MPTGGINTGGGRGREKAESQKRRRPKAEAAVHIPQGTH